MELRSRQPPTGSKRPPLPPIQLPEEGRHLKRPRVARGVAWPHPLCAEGSYDWGTCLKLQEDPLPNKLLLGADEPCSQESTPCLLSQPSLDSQVSADTVLHEPSLLDTQEAPCSSSFRPVSLASRRGLMVPQQLNVDTECSGSGTPFKPMPLSPESLKCYVAVQPGWFSRCRGCAQLTGATLPLRQLVVPFCCICQQRLTSIPSEQQSRYQDQLLHIHHGWRNTGN